MERYEQEKLLHEAEKRDQFRAKLPESKRHQAWAKGGEIVKLTLKQKDDLAKRKRLKFRNDSYDRAMQTATVGLHRTKEIETFIF